MKLIVDWANIEQFFTAADNPFRVAKFAVRQDSLIPLQIQASENGAAKDLSAWQVEVAIQGGAGVPTGTTGDAVYAAYTGAGGFSYNATTKTFTGTLDTRTAEMAALIGPAAANKTVLAVKLTRLDGTEAEQWTIPCDVLAPVIESGITGAVSLGPVAFTVPAGQAEKVFPFPNCPADADLAFIKKSSGPAVDGYIVTVNEDDPTQTTVTVTLAGVAPADMNFKAFVVRA